MENKITKAVKRENFIKVFLDDLRGLLKIENFVQYSVMVYIWKKLDWNNKPFYLQQAEKEEIIKELDLKNTQSVSNALTRLVENKLLKRIHKGYYEINPKFFFKGDDDERYRLVVEYEIIKDPKTPEKTTTFKKNEPVLEAF